MHGVVSRGDPRKVARGTRHCWMLPRVQYHLCLQLQSSEPAASAMNEVGPSYPVLSVIVLRLAAAAIFTRVFMHSAQEYRPRSISHLVFIYSIARVMIRSAKDHESLTLRSLATAAACHCQCVPERPVALG